METFRFAATRLPAEAEDLRARARAFLDAERGRGEWASHRSTWTSFDPEFSRRMGEAGLIAVTFPKEYGGADLSSLARYAVAEEMLAAGAPCGAHWVAERQSGPQILRHGSDRAKAEILPRIARGECFFGIGMSEPGSGSDLAAVRTKATRVDGGWRIDGSKIWTSNAHRVQYLIALVRTGPAGEGAPRRPDPVRDRHGRRQRRNAPDSHGITCSMSRAGNVWDNSAMESFFSSLKTERIGRKVYRTRDAARADVFDYIERFYNPRRRHSKVGYLSPMAFEERAMQT